MIEESFQIRFYNSKTFRKAVRVFDDNRDSIFLCYSKEPQDFDIDPEHCIFSFSSRLILNSFMNDLAMYDIKPDQDFYLL